MTKAREIAEERFAKGEISKEELDTILDSLGVKPDIQDDGDAQTAFDIKKLGWIIPIVFLFWGYNSLKNELVIESLSADSPLFGVATVKSTLFNKGGEQEYSFHVEKGNSETKYCEGRIFIAEKERRQISFKCSALNNYTGNFRLITRKI